jgi:hypothetical protein
LAAQWFTLEKCEELLKTPSRKRVLARLLRIIERYKDECATSFSGTWRPQRGALKREP